MLTGKCLSPHSSSGVSCELSAFFKLTCVLINSCEPLCKICDGWECFITTDWHVSNIYRIGSSDFGAGLSCFNIREIGQAWAGSTLTRRENPFIIITIITMNSDTRILISLHIQASLFAKLSRQHHWCVHSAGLLGQINKQTHRGGCAQSTTYRIKVAALANIQAPLM